MLWLPRSTTLLCESASHRSSCLVKNFVRAISPSSPVSGWWLFTTLSSYICYTRRRHHEMARPAARKISNIDIDCGGVWCSAYTHYLLAFINRHTTKPEMLKSWGDYFNRSNFAVYDEKHYTVILMIHFVLILQGWRGSQHDMTAHRYRRIHTYLFRRFHHIYNALISPFTREHIDSYSHETYICIVKSPQSPGAHRSLPYEIYLLLRRYDVPLFQFERAFCHNDGGASDTPPKHAISRLIADTASSSTSSMPHFIKYALPQHLLYTDWLIGLIL